MVQYEVMNSKTRAAHTNSMDNADQEEGENKDDEDLKTTILGIPHTPYTTSGNKRVERKAKEKGKVKEAFQQEMAKEKENVSTVENQVT